MGKQQNTDSSLHKKTRVTVRLDPHLEHELEQLARRTGKDKSLLIRAALLHLVNQCND